MPPSQTPEKTDSLKRPEDILGSPQASQEPPESKSPSTKTLTDSLEELEELDKKTLLTQRESDLLSLLLELIEHTRVRDASGTWAVAFCAGCQDRRMTPCPYERISGLAHGLDRRRTKGIVLRHVGGGTITARDKNYPSSAPDA